MTQNATKLATAPVRVLWMDDQPDTIENYRKFIEHEKGRGFLLIDIVDSIPETKEKLSSGQYGALVVDFNMERSPVATPVNGASFLKDVNYREKCFPTFVYSSYLGEERYLKHLRESHPIKVINKGETTFDRPVSAHPFFKAVYEAGRDYVESRYFKPETIPFDEYVKEPAKYEKEMEMYWKKHQRWLRAKMQEKGFVWAIVCGGTIVAGSNDISDFPSDEQLEDYGHRTNLIPFPMFTKNYIPEESLPPKPPGCDWNECNAANDYYPTFQAAIGRHELYDDFDTGAPKTWISDQLIERKLVNIFMPFGGHEGFHLGRPFSGTFKKVTVRIVDSDGKSASKEMVIGIVKNWESSPFVQINDARRALFGRDLLREFELEVCLDSKQKTTRVKLL